MSCLLVKLGRGVHSTFAPTFISLSVTCKVFVSACRSLSWPCLALLCSRNVFSVCRSLWAGWRKALRCCRGPCGGSHGASRLGIGVGAGDVLPAGRVMCTEQPTLRGAPRNSCMPLGDRLQESRAHGERRLQRSRSVDQIFQAGIRDPWSFLCFGLTSARTWCLTCTTFRKWKIFLISQCITICTPPTQINDTFI